MAVRRLAEFQPEHFAFSPDNRIWAERAIARFPEGRQASAAIPLLWRAQEQEGWVTKAAIESVAEMLGMPVIRVLEVATFYTMFHLEPVGRKAHVQVCGTTPCMLRGAGDLIDVCRARIAPHPHELSLDEDFSWEEVECLGACVNAPMVQISKDTYEDLTPESFEAILDAFERGERPQPGPQNGRQFSMPITRATTLTDIAYAADDVRGERGNGASPTQPRAGESAAAVGANEPQPVAVESAGGEPLDAERERRAERAGASNLPGGADPASGAAEAQEIGRVDPTGRSDEAALRAVGSDDPSRSAASKKSARRAGRGAGADKAAQPRSDRDSPSGDKEG